MQKIRVFIALNLPQDTKKHIKKIQQRLSERFPEGIKWINPENIHLTVAFLGGRAQEEIRKISQILEDLASKQTAIILRPHYVKSFTYVIAIKMLSHKIRTFYEKMVQEFQKEGIVYKERRKFKPHITIGRLQTRLPKKFKGKANFPGFKIEKIDLMKSTLLSEGPEYEIVESYSFKKKSEKQPI